MLKRTHIPTFQETVALIKNREEVLSDLAANSDAEIARALAEQGASYTVDEIWRIRKHQQTLMRQAIATASHHFPWHQQARMQAQTGISVERWQAYLAPSEEDREDS